MFNAVRAVGSGGLGIASGVLDGAGVGTVFNLPGPGGSQVPVTYGAVAEVVGLAVGVGLQALSPATLPNLADGLTDGGIALFARRVAVYGTEMLAGKTTATFGQTAGWNYNMPLGQQQGYQVNGAAAAARYGNVHSGSYSGAGMRAQSTFSGIIPNRVN